MAERASKPWRWWKAVAVVIAIMILAVFLMEWKPAPRLTRGPSGRSYRVLSTKRVITPSASYTQLTYLVDSLSPSLVLRDLADVTALTAAQAEKNGDTGAVIAARRIIRMIGPIQRYEEFTIPLSRYNGTWPVPRVDTAALLAMRAR